MSNEIELKPFDNNDEVKNKADGFIRTILYSAPYFEHNIGLKPIVFMSRDVFRIILAGARDSIICHIYGEPMTICGYNLELTLGENMFCLGYRLPIPM